MDQAAGQGWRASASLCLSARVFSVERNPVPQLNGCSGAERPPRQKWPKCVAGYRGSKAIEAQLMAKSKATGHGGAVRAKSELSDLVRLPINAPSIPPSRVDFADEA